AFSPDGQWLVTGTFLEYRFWEVGSWRKRHALPREKGSKTIGRIVFSPDGKMLAVLHGVSEVHLVDPATGRPFAHLPTSRPPCGGPVGPSPGAGGVWPVAGGEGPFRAWALGLTRGQLGEVGLDGALPPSPPPAEGAKPLRVKVLAAERPPPSAELDARAYLE